MKANRVILFTCIGLSAGVVVRDMNMADMDGHSTMGHSVMGQMDTHIDLNTSSPLIPIPHVAHHHHNMPILQTDLLPEERLYWENYDATNYFNHPTANTSALWSHIILMIITTVFVYPIALVFKNIGCWKCYTGTLIVHSILTFCSLFRYSQFMHSIPDLYPLNAYNKMSWILLFTTIAQLVSFFLNRGTSTDYVRCNANGTFDDQPIELYSRSTSNEYDTDEEIKESPNLQLLSGIIGATYFKKMSLSIHFGSSILFNFLNWAHFFYFLIYIPTGVATFLVLGTGVHVFNLLAHFIKGGIFFAYGLLSLSRYCGAFENKGWAWNSKSYSNTHDRWSRIQPKGLITMEMIECSIILFYGCTNVFMEHMANPGGEWSAKDLQHASLAFIFIGCGLCGVVTEIKLNTWRFERVISDEQPIKALPGYSPNPFPTLTIYWTGYLMSKHEQASQTSTAIHSQWGNLFVLACAFRFITYILQLLMKSELKVPSRPISELLVSFSLICGGLIFMESCDPMVLLFEWYGLGPMFTMNISLGVAALIMSWEMVIFCFKDYLRARSSAHS